MESPTRVPGDDAYDDMTSTDRAAMLLQLGGGDVDLEVESAPPKSTKKKKGGAKAEEGKPLGIWRLYRGADQTLHAALTEDEANNHDIVLEIKMPALKKRIAMNLSLSEQPHNGIQLNGEPLDVEPLVGSTGTIFTWEDEPSTEFKIMATKKVPFAHGCDHETRYLLFVNGCEARTGKTEAFYWWEINFRLVMIGLSGILIFLVGLGLSYIPEIGSVAAYVLRVTAILAIVGLYELVVGLVSLSKLHGKCALSCLCSPGSGGGAQANVGGGVGGGGAHEGHTTYRAVSETNYQDETV